MARRRKKKRDPSYLEEALLLLMGALVTVCLISAGYGFFIRHAGAHEIPQGLRIEVLNGTGQKGLAQKVARSLMERGVDVLKVGNADHFDYRESIISVRSPNTKIVALARAMGCGNVVEQLKEDSFVDATLTIGADYSSLDLGVESESRLND